MALRDFRVRGEVQLAEVPGFAPEPDEFPKGSGFLHGVKLHRLRRQNYYPRRNRIAAQSLSSLFISKKEMTKMDSETIADTYIDLWNETDEALRQAMLRRSWSAEIEYRDPLMQAKGRPELSGLVAGVQAQFPEFRFRRVGSSDTSGECARFSWELGPATGDAPIAGTDVVELDHAGAIIRVIGFLDRVPAGEQS
jgi:hypothetical protein